MLTKVPYHLWPRHDTDVGFVKSANPVITKPKLPWRAQYPLKPNAEQGISKTIEGLVNAGVLVETHSPCSMPILPV